MSLIANFGLVHENTAASGPGAGWLYFNDIPVDNTGNLNALNDQVKLSLNALNFDFGLALSDGADFRFYRGSTLLNHWIEHIDIFNATIWVKVTGVPPGVSRNIRMYYGNSSATTTSSFSNTMTRFQTSQSNATYVVRFGDGSGSTAANIGSAGGTMSIVGGKTWNSNDIWGESSKSLTLDGSTGYVEKTGLLDSWGTAGSIHLSFTLSSIAADQTIFSKRNRAAAGGGDDGDYVQLYFKNSTGKLCLKFSAGSSQKLVLDGTTTLATGTKYTVSLVWNTKLTDSQGGWMILWMNGIRECDTFNAVSYPPDGSASPFRIGAMSNITTGSAETFASFKINDFAVQTEQMYYAKICAVHQWRNHYMIDEKSKWDVSVTPAWGGDPHYSSEPFMIYEGGKFLVYYSYYDGSQFFIRRKETTALIPGTTPTFTNDQLILGHGTGGESGDALRAMVRKFGSTYYMYYRDALLSGDIVCVTSSDGVAFSSKVTVLPTPGSGFGQYGFFNCDVVDGGDGYYYMTVDELDTGGLNIYLDGIFRCATPNGTFVPYGTNPKMSMVPGIDQTGLVGGPSMQKIGSNIHIWFGASPVHPATGSLPNDIFRDDSTDWNNWTPTETPVILRERPQEYDQASDSCVIEVSGETYIVYQGADNRVPFVSYINYAHFPGPITKLVKDVSATLTQTITNVPINLAPLIYWDNGPAFMNSNGDYWTDRVGGFTLSKASVERPVYTPNVLNGRPAFVFDANDLLTRPTITEIESIGAFTIWVVGKGWTMSQDDGSTNNGRISVQQAAGTVYALPNGVTGYGSVVESDAYNYTLIIFDGSQSGNSNRLKVYYNGSLTTLTFSGTVPTTTGTSGSAAFYLHKAVGVGSAGSMCEMGIVTRAINSTEITNLNAFLAARYGL